MSIDYYELLTVTMGYQAGNFTAEIQSELRNAKAKDHEKNCRIAI